MTRKIIQIAVAMAADPSGDWERTCFALCDDGTLWRQELLSKDWHALPPIPQDEDET